MQRNGYPMILHSVKGADSVKDGVEWLKSYDIVVHPRCLHTGDELTHYSWKTDPLTDRVLPILEDKKNHVIDALRYACEALRRGPQEIAIG
jgi:phage terminase large subunit